MQRFSYKCFFFAVAMQAIFDHASHWFNAFQSSFINFPLIPVWLVKAKPIRSIFNSKVAEYKSQN